MPLIPPVCFGCGAEFNRTHKIFLHKCREIAEKEDIRSPDEEIYGPAPASPTLQARILNDMKITRMCCRAMHLTSEQYTHLFGGAYDPPKPGLMPRKGEEEGETEE